MYWMLKFDEAWAIVRDAWLDKAGWPNGNHPGRPTKLVCSN